MHTSFTIRAGFARAADGSIAPEIRAVVDEDVHLLLEGEGKEVLSHAEDAVNELFRDAMVFNVEEADSSAGFSDIGGNLPPVIYVAASHAPKINNRNRVKISCDRRPVMISVDGWLIVVVPVFVPHCDSEPKIWVLMWMRNKLPIQGK